MLTTTTFLLNYITERRQITKINVDKWLSLVFFPEKIIYKETKQAFLCLYIHLCTTVLYEYMKSHRNEANNLFDNLQVRIGIYRHNLYSL